MVRPSSRAAAAKAASASRFNAGARGTTVNAAGSEALPKTKRLAKRAEFLRVYEKGQKIVSRYVVLFFAANGLPQSRIGITATKKLGKANIRNRLKRWTREVYRRQREPMELDQRSLDVVVNVKPNAADAAYQDYSHDLARALARVVNHGGKG